MERTRPQLNTTSEQSSVHGNAATPFAQQTVGLTKQAYIELQWKAQYWQAQYERLLTRNGDTSMHFCPIWVVTIAVG